MRDLQKNSECQPIYGAFGPDDGPTHRPAAIPKAGGLEAATQGPSVWLSTFPLAREQPLGGQTKKPGRAGLWDSENRVIRYLRPAAFLRASTMSVFSQVKFGRLRPK